MKKFALVASFLLISTFIFSAPVKPPMYGSSVFDDPFLTDLSITENSTPHRVDISVTMDHSVNYTVKITFIVFGNWVNMGWDYKEFNVYVPPYNTYKLTQFPIDSYDDPWVSSYDIIYMGPV